MSVQQPAEWVGGQFPFQTKIEGIGSSELLLLTLWVELPSGLVVGQVLEDPAAPETTFGQSLMRAMASPLIGEPRRPLRVRVASDALANQLSFVETVQVAPTPELDGVLKSLDAYVGQGSYYSDPLIGQAELKAYWDAAHALWAQAPWEFTDPDALLRVDIAKHGIQAGAVAVMGEDNGVPGIALFPDIDDYQGMVDVFSAEPDTEISSVYSAVYMMFRAAEDTPPAMRKEIEELGWELPGGRYPVLGCLARSQVAPVLYTDVSRMTAIASALARFSEAHADAMEAYGEQELTETYVDATGVQTVLTVPHPDVDLDDFEAPPRAETLPGVVNPYELPLSEAELKRLGSALRGFTLHRMIGMFCALASTPKMVLPSTWMGMLGEALKPKNQGEAQELMGLCIRVHSSVMERTEEGSIEALVPVAEAVDACSEWSRGYTAITNEAEIDEQNGEAVDSLFAIYAVAGDPEYLAVLEEHRGEVSVEERLDAYRETLSMDAESLYEHWAKARAEGAELAAKAMQSGPPKGEPVRVGPKTGRNDPCPCGSGKKFKKCHG